MSPLRIGVGTLTLVYALYLMVEGALGVIGHWGHPTLRLMAAFGGWMHLVGQPWWRSVFEILAGFSFAAAGAQLASTLFTAWPLFALGAAAELIARWTPFLVRYPARATLHALVAADEVWLTVLAAGLIAYLILDTLSAMSAPSSTSPQPKASP